MVTQGAISQGQISIGNGPDTLIPPFSPSYQLLENWLTNLYTKDTKFNTFWICMGTVADWDPSCTAAKILMIFSLEFWPGLCPK